MGRDTIAHSGNTVQVSIILYIIQFKTCIINCSIQRTGVPGAGGEGCGEPAGDRGHGRDGADLAGGGDAAASRQAAQHHLPPITTQTAILEMMI